MKALVRETKETRIRVGIEKSGEASSISTSVPFLDHMLGTLARYSGLRIAIEASGDLRHHIIEDVAIAMGTVLRTIVSPTAARYGDATVPMDDALVHASLDIGGRPFYEGPIPSALYDHWMRSFCDNAEITLHIRALRGHDRHHVVEAAFKAVGLALRQALDESGAVFSTKGSVKWGDA